MSEAYWRKRQAQGWNYGAQQVVKKGVARYTEIDISYIFNTFYAIAARKWFYRYTGE